MNLVTDFYRHEESLRRLIRELARAPDALVLDVGCRKGELTRSLAVDKRLVIAADIERFEQWSDPAPGISFVNANATALPFKDGCFDVVVSGECLQYVGDWRRALDEFHRVLRPDGRLVFSCPNGSPLINGLDPYNLVHLLKRLFKPSAVKSHSMVKHVPAKQILGHRVADWRHEAFLRRGSFAFIYSAFMADNLQKWRLQLDGSSRIHSWIAQRCLKPGIKLCFWIMKRDFALPLRALSYNAVYRFRKKRGE